MDDISGGVVDATGRNPDGSLRFEAATTLTEEIEKKPIDW